MAKAGARSVVGLRTNGPDLPVGRCLLSILILSALVAHPGCSLHIADISALADPHKVCVLSPQTAPVTVSEEGHTSFTEAPALRQPEPTTLSYNRLWWLFARVPVVRGRLPNGRTYPVMLDTGCLPYPLVVTLDIALQNHMPVRLQPPELCYVKRLNIGGTTVEGFLASVFPYQWQVRFLGIPLYRVRGFVIGLPVLRHFQYILLDNAHGEVELSTDVPFRPDDPEAWVKYPLLLEEDQLMVDLPVAGKRMRLMLDTAGGATLKVSQSDWAELRQRVQVTGSSQKEYPSWRYMVSALEFRVAELQIGERVVRNARVLVPEKADQVSLVGMGSFEDRTVVLDFGRRYLWVERKGH